MAVPDDHAPAADLPDFAVRQGVDQPDGPAERQGQGSEQLATGHQISVNAMSKVQEKAVWSGLVKGHPGGDTVQNVPGGAWKIVV